MIASFLFTDFPGSTSKRNPTLKYHLVSDGRQPMLSLWFGDRQLYSGVSRYQLAYILMNEVIFHCIDKNRQHHALHAGSVKKGERCFIFPGKSGKGKSTLTAWLIANGFQYLTDELVFISNNCRVIPLTRPVSLKVNSSHVSWLLKKNHTDQIITDEMGSMIPHRLLNPDFSAHEPFATHILFPEYREGGELSLKEITPAKSSLYLLQSHVNARNLPGHGITELCNIVRKCRSYDFVYGSYDDLEAVFHSSVDDPFA